MNLGNLGATGVTFYGADAFDLSGRSLSTAGDINGDGFDDILIGAHYGDGAANGRFGSGDSNVVFGKSDWSATPTVDLGNLGPTGVTIYGVNVSDAAGLAEGKEQEFGVVAVVQPGAGKPGDDGVHRLDQRAFGEDVMGHDMGAGFQVGRDDDAVGGKQHHVAETAGLLVGQGFVKGDTILGEDQRQGATPEVGTLTIEKVGKAGIAHHGSGGGRAAKSAIRAADARDVEARAGLR